MLSNIPEILIFGERCWSAPSQIISKSSATEQTFVFSEGRRIGSGLSQRKRLLPQLIPSGPFDPWKACDVKSYILGFLFRIKLGLGRKKKSLFCTTVKEIILLIRELATRRIY